MAQFKVGDRVRIISAADRSEVQVYGLIGATGEIESLCQDDPIYECTVRLDGRRGLVYARFERLAPLTDPGAERFVESLKKLAREPRVEKVSA